MSVFDFLKDTAEVAGNVISAGVSAVLEDSEKLDEIKRINTMCDEMKAQFIEIENSIKRDFEREHTEYLRIVKKIDSQFETFELLKNFLNDDDNAVNRNVNLNNETQLLTDTDKPFDTTDVVAYGKGAVAGLAGGGLTLALGGFGIMGGIAVIATAFLGPAIAVTAYFTDKQIADAYEDAKQKELKAAEFQKKGSTFLKECAKGVNTFSYINREMYAFSAFFDELLNMSLMASAINKSESYFSLLTDSANTIVLYEKLSVLTAEGNFNENIISEIAAVKSRADTCKYNFYKYLTNLSPRHQEILNELRTQKLINDKLQSEIQWHKDNSPQNYIVRNRTIRNEFDKALRESKTELDIISAWMNFDVVDESMQRQFENLLRRGVIIKIVYGIGDMSPDTVNKRNRRTLNVAERLIQRFGNYPNFKMKCTDTHEKLFICDERFYVLSSMNILSFKADYNGDDNRKESGEASNNVALIREYRKLWFNF